MSATFNRKAIMTAAHFRVRWWRASGRKGSYAAILGEAQSIEWKKARDARAAAEAARKALAEGRVAPVFAARVPTFHRPASTSPLRAVGF